jgi:DNA-binding NtrC family response regulator
VPQVAEDAMQQLMAYDWPGNVRQLMNAAQNMLILAEGDRVEPRHLPPEIAEQSGASGGGEQHVPAGMSLDQLEKQAIRNALRIHAGNREAAAKMLGIGERTLYRKLKEYGLK